MLCIEYADDNYKWCFHNKTNYINNILSHLKENNSFCRIIFIIKWELKSLPILYSKVMKMDIKICY